jgi:hypothetical protein
VKQKAHVICKMSLQVLNCKRKEMKKEIIRVSEKPQKCPVCSSNKISIYLWGMPVFSNALHKELAEGKVKLGGCCVTGDDPAYHCMECHTDMYNSR